MTILVTGGAGFIGTNFIQGWLQHSEEDIINLDKLTYASNIEFLKSIPQQSQIKNIHGNICDSLLVHHLLSTYTPRAIIHFAAETHVDRSIADPSIFMQTNVMGTYTLLETAFNWFKNQPDTVRQKFRFLHISTDEVYGSLTKTDLPFTEQSPYHPNNPYAASKAASDHIVRSYFQTYGFPVLTTHCSNNYGPHQCHEKLIPLMIEKAINEHKLPIYGDGQHSRDWLYVGDHCAAIRLVLKKGKLGETYNIGACNEVTNLEIVHSICTILDSFRPRKDKLSYHEQISFVTDRLGHDRRYALNPHKIKSELGWSLQEDFQTGLKKTVEWYLQNNPI